MGEKFLWNPGTERPDRLRPPIRLQGVWQEFGGPGEILGAIDVTLPEFVTPPDQPPDGIFGGLNRSGIEPTFIVAYVEALQLNTTLRRRGIGTCLYRAFAQIAIEHGATHLAGDATEQALRARRRAFGEDRLRFYARPATDFSGEFVDYPELTPEDALMRLYRQQRYPLAPGFLAVTDLRGLDTAGWAPDTTTG